MDRKQLKAEARRQIKGKIGLLFLINLIIAALSSAASLALAWVPGGSLIISLIITPAFALSLIRIYLNVAHDGTPVVNDAFSGFDDFWSAFKVQFITGLFIWLWSLLLIIPGIIKGISYSMSMFVLAENKGKPAMECIEESQRIMEGHKKEYFVLCLSFIGWLLLCVVTFGIACLWVTPYMQMTMANLYNTLKPKPRVIEGVAEEAAAEPAAE